MTFPLPLRLRVTLAFMVLGFVLTALFSAAALFVTEDYEHIIAGEILRGQADDYALRIANHLPATLPQTQRLSGYRMEDPSIPQAFAHLGPGIHEDNGRDGLHVGVFDTSIGRLLFEIDLSDIERLEHLLNRFLAALIVTGTLLAAWLGWLLSGAALKPVRLLAAHVDALPDTPVPSNFAASAGSDEVGHLARAIDGYQNRLVEADTREQAFFADASHELRTPLSVIQGVVEVLQDAPDASPAAQARVERLARGVRDMRNLLEAMLAAARRTPLIAEAIPAAAFLQQAGADALNGKRDVTLTVDASGELHAPRQEARLLITRLAHNLAQAHGPGSLNLRLSGNQLTLAFAQADAEVGPSDRATPRADLGTGSALMDRLAARLGWSVDFSAAHQVAIRWDRPEH